MCSHWHEDLFSLLQQVLLQMSCLLTFCGTQALVLTQQVLLQVPGLLTFCGTQALVLTQQVLQILLQMSCMGPDTE